MIFITVYNKFVVKSSISIIDNFLLRGYNKEKVLQEVRYERILDLRRIRCGR